MKENHACMNFPSRFQLLLLIPDQADAQCDDQQGGYSPRNRMGNP